jgi:hypothetical protein
MAPMPILLKTFIPIPRETPIYRISNPKKHRGANVSTLQKSLALPVTLPLSVRNDDHQCIDLYLHFH